VFFAVTYIDGSVEEIEADECQDNGARYLTFVRYRIPFVTTVYTEIVRRLDRYAVARVDGAVPISPLPSRRWNAGGLYEGPTCVSRAFKSCPAAWRGKPDSGDQGSVRAGMTVSQNSEKSLSRLGCGPDTDSTESETNSSSLVSVGVPP
jgi:hypothetical protein